jgi:hypothetical protein
MSVETENLDLYVEAIAKMLVFPPPLQVREVEIKPGFVIFMFTMNGNEATSTIAYERGSVQAIAKILDTMPYPTFVTGDAFLIMAAFMGGVVTSTLNFTNANHPANKTEEVKSSAEKGRSKK